LTVLSADNIEKDDRRINELEDARAVVSWLFRTASIGQVSPYFELEDKYVVVVMTGEIEEGTSKLVDVRAKVTAELKNELKAGIISEQLTAVEGTLEDQGNVYEANSNIFNATDLKFNTNNLPNISGDASAAIGTAFALEQGQKSDPVEVETGIVVIELLSKSPSAEIADYTNYADQVTNRIGGRTSFFLNNAIRDYADIVDDRYKFF